MRELRKGGIKRWIYFYLTKVLFICVTIILQCTCRQDKLRNNSRKYVRDVLVESCPVKVFSLPYTLMRETVYTNVEALERKVEVLCNVSSHPTPTCWTDLLATSNDKSSRCRWSNWIVQINRYLWTSLIA